MLRERGVEGGHLGGDRDQSQLALFFNKVQHAWEFDNVLLKTLDATLPVSNAEQRQVDED